MMMEINAQGVLVANGIAIGQFDDTEHRLVLDLGWMRSAGVKLTVLGDPMHDRPRKVLERPKDVKRTDDGGEQKSIADELADGTK